MERKGNNIKAFLALVKAGLWNGVNENLNDNEKLKASRVMLKKANRAVGNGKSRTFAI